LYSPWLAHRLGSYLCRREAEYSVGLEAELKREREEERKARLREKEREKNGGEDPPALERKDPNPAPPPPPPFIKEQHTLVYFCPDMFDVVNDEANQPPPLPPDTDPQTLVFDSRFESGNLKQAVRVKHRQLETGPGPPQGLPSVVLPQPVDQEYDLLCRNDTYTTGHIQWYYFSVRGARPGMRVRFNITNMMKKNSLYNFGMKPTVFSTSLLASTGKG
jgi:hypothetical protein